jgi:cell division protease FtsH
LFITTKQFTDVANRTPSNDENEGGVTDGQTPGGGRWRLIVWVVIATLFALWAYGYWGQGAAGGERISYSEFRKQLQNGNVEQVVVEGNNLTGELKSSRVIR